MSIPPGSCSHGRWALTDLTDLVLYCEREKVPFVTFDDFSSIFKTVKAIVEGKTTCEAEAKGRL